MISRATIKRVANVCALGSAGCIFVAGIMKFADLGSFEHALRSWTLFQSPPVRAAVAIVVPSIEVAIAGAFLAIPPVRRTSSQVLIALLLVFSVAFLWQSLMSPVNCACWGALERHLRLRSDATSILVRNGLLLLPLVAWFCLSGSRGGPIPNRDTSQPIRPALPTRAFTLVELLVVIAIIGVIVSIVLIALARSRTHSRISASTSNVRQHALVFAAYAGDFRDSTPYFTRPLPGEQSEIPTPDGTVRTVFYFSAFFTWTYILAPGYYANDAGHPTFRSPLESLAPNQFAYLYPCQFLADPAFWRPETRTLPTAQFRNIRVSEVAFPAAKAFITDNTMWYAPLERDRASTVAGCVDGHAQRVWDSQMTRQYGTGDGAAPPYTPFTRHFASYNPLLHTVGGVHAPDFGPP